MKQEMLIKRMIYTLGVQNFRIRGSRGKNKDHKRKIQFKGNKGVVIRYRNLIEKLKLILKSRLRAALFL